MADDKKLRHSVWCLKYCEKISVYFSLSLFFIRDSFPTSLSTSFFLVRGGRGECVRAPRDRHRVRAERGRVRVCAGGTF